MKEKFKAPEKNTTRQQRDSQPIRYTFQNTGNQDAPVSILVELGLNSTPLVEFGHKLDEKMKAMLSEIKENVQRTNSNEKETRNQINGLEQKEEINIKPQ